MAIPGGPGTPLTPTDSRVTALGPNAGRIVASALAHGVDPFVALSVAQGEGGFSDPAPIGDQNTSFGPYQLHIGGAMPAQYSSDPAKANQFANSPAGIDYAMTRIAAATRGKSGAAAIQAAVDNFERPADPTPEVQRDVQFYRGLHGAGSGGAAAAAGSGQAAAPTSGGSASGAGGSNRRLFDCGSGTSIPLASFSIPPVGCYVVDALVFMGYAVGGLILVGAGALLMMKTKSTPAAAFKGVVSPAGGVFKGAAGASLDRAEAQGKAQAQAGRSEAAAARTQASETHLAATRRAQLRTSRARARKTEAEARSAKQNVGTSYSLSPNAERALAKARKSPPRGRPDRMA